MVKIKKSNLSRDNSIVKRITTCGLVITLIFTPWFNKDSIVIPKQIILVATAFYLLPKLVLVFRDIYKFRLGKVILIILILDILQMVLVIVKSEAPFEQQFFGRGGRLLGFITYFSLSIILVTAIRYFNLRNLWLVNRALFLTGTVVCLYAILQSFGADFFEWDSRTNAVISTLGNPNYTSAFAALFALPTIAFMKSKNNRNIFPIAVILLAVFTIYVTESIQGYIALLVSVSFFILIKIYYKSIKVFVLTLMLMIIGFTFIVLGSMGHSFLSKFLYKASVESRGDFWRSAFRASNSNPFFGVGMDSFGDVYLQYRDQVAANHAFAEYTDSAHNFILDFSSQGGYLLAILRVLIIAITVFSFLQIQYRLGKVNIDVLAAFSSWMAIQATFIISPLSIPILFWNAVLSGAIIGTLLETKMQLNVRDNIQQEITNKGSPYASPIFVLISLLIMFPLFNVDRLYAQSLKNGDGNLGIKVVNMFPRNTEKFSTVGRLLLESGQNNYSLDVAQNALKFNYNSISAWGLILVNPVAPYEDRVKAKREILRLDPLNRDVPKFEIQKNTIQSMLQ